MMIRFPIFLLALICLTTFFSAQAQTSATWQGKLDGVPTWITIIPRGHTISITDRRTKPWWAWGNTATDAYLFAFERARNVKLILEFVTSPGGLPEARFYLLERGTATLDYHVGGTQLTVLSNGGYPTYTLRPHGAGWLANGKTNYNLTLHEDGVEGDVNIEPDGTPDVLVRVGSNKPGEPTWETKSLLNDPSRSRGYPRFDAKLRMKGGPPFKLAKPVMPTFPHLGIADGLPWWFMENPNPFFFDLKNRWFTLQPFTGFQNAGIYAVHSINPPPRLNFEAPFVFYSFDPKTRFPQMTMRGFVFPQGDLFGPEYKGTNHTAIRYSWKTWDEEKWAYNLHLSGNELYSNRIRIGEEAFDAISGKDFPVWASSKVWPQVTFVEATEGFHGSEGLYYYNPADMDWLAGQTPGENTWLSEPTLPEAGELSVFSSLGLPPTFRGEYTVAHDQPPTLYLSPIDRRVHLLHAQGGTWNLGKGRFLRTHNIAGGSHIDGWTREHIKNFDRLTQGFEEGKQAARAYHSSDVEESLYVLGSYVVYSGAGYTEIRRADVKLVSEKVSPPVDKKSWQAFREDTARYVGEARSPENLRQWTSDLVGPALSVQGGKIEDPSFSRGRYKFTLTLQGSSETSGDLGVLSLEGLKADRYVVTFDSKTDAWSLAPATPPRIDATFSAREPSLLTPGQLGLVISNQGNIDYFGKAKLVIGKDDIMSWDNLHVPGNDEISEYLTWAPEVTGRKAVKLVVGQRTLALGSINVLSTPRISGFDTLALSLGDRLPIFLLPLALTFLVAVSSVGYIWWQR